MERRPFIIHSRYAIIIIVVVGILDIAMMVTTIGSMVIDIIAAKIEEAIVVDMTVIKSLI
jgi:hypothetical protein